MNSDVQKRCDFGSGRSTGTNIIARSCGFPIISFSSESQRPRWPSWSWELLLQLLRRSPTQRRKFTQSELTFIFFFFFPTYVLWRFFSNYFLITPSSSLHGLRVCSSSSPVLRPLFFKYKNSYCSLPWFFVSASVSLLAGFFPSPDARALFFWSSAGPPGGGAADSDSDSDSQLSRHSVDS